MIAVVIVLLLAWLAALAWGSAKLLWSISDLRPNREIVSYYRPVRQLHIRQHPRLGHYIQPRHATARIARA